MAADGTIRIDVDLNDNGAQNGLNNINDQARNIDDRPARNLGNTLATVGKTAAIAVAGLAGIAAGAVALARPLVEAAGSAAALNSQFTQVFGALEGQATKALSNIAEQTNIIPTRLQGAFTQIAAFARTTGADQAAALDLTTRATLAAADSAAFYDRSIEDVTESLQSFLKGNFENDSALGISATETTRNAIANQLYGKSFRDLDEAQKQLALLALVEQGNELSGALGQAAREGEGLENVSGNLSQAFTDLKARAGAVILQPAIDGIVTLTNVINNINVEAIVERIQNVYNTILESTDGIVTSVVEGFRSLGEFLLPILQQIFDYVIDTWQRIFDGINEILPTIIAIVNDALEFLADLWDKYGQTLIDLVTSAVTAVVEFLAETFSTLIAFFNENGETIFAGIQAIWTAIFAVFNFFLPAILLVVRTIWDAIKNVISGALDVILGTAEIFIAIFSGDFRGLWDAIVRVFTGAIDLILGLMTLSFFGGLRTLATSFLRTFTSTIKGLWDDVINFFRNGATTTVNTVVGWVNNVIAYIANLVSQGRNFIGSFVDDGIAFFKKFADDVIGAVKDLPGQFIDIGKNVISGFINGLKSINPVKAVTGVFNGVKDTVLGIFDIHSPSRWARDMVVGNIAAGFEVGTVKYRTEFEQAGADIGTFVQSDLYNGLNYSTGNALAAQQTNNNINNSNTNNITVRSDREAQEIERTMRRLQFGF